MSEGTNKGTYAKLVPDQATQARIINIVNQINVNNPCSASDLHVTVIYSRNECADIKDLPVNVPVVAHGSAFDIFHMEGGNQCLVLKLDSDSMHQLHQSIRDNHGGTHDYPTYQPHITLSYDYPHPVPNSSLIEYFDHLTFDQYVVEPLTLGWRVE